MSVLVYRVGHLGDSIVAIPAIHAISNKHSSDKLYLLTNSNNSAINFLMKLDIFERCILIYDGYSFLFSLISLFIFIKKYNIKYIYNLSTRFSKKSQKRDKFFFKYICGVNNYDSVEPVIYDANIRIKYQYESDRLLSVVNYNSNYYDYIRNIISLGGKPCGLKSKYIIVCPFSNMKSKNWDVNNFIIIINHILNKYSDINVVLIGAASKYDLGQTNIDSPRVINLIGKTDIFDLFSIIHNSILMVSVDTGPIHIAALLNKYSINIFSSRDQNGLWEPRFADNIRNDVHCSLCMKESCENNFCIQNISANYIINKIDIYLSMH